MKASAPTAAEARPAPLRRHGKDANSVTMHAIARRLRPAPRRPWPRHRDRPPPARTAALDPGRQRRQRLVGGEEMDAAVVHVGQAAAELSRPIRMQVRGGHDAAGQGVGQFRPLLRGKLQRVGQHGVEGRRHRASAPTASGPQKPKQTQSRGRCTTSAPRPAETSPPVRSAQP